MKTPSIPHRLRIGLLGAGRIGTVHATTLVQRIPTAELVAIADPQIEAAQSLADQLRVPNVTPDAHTILNDPNIDAVLICTPTASHPALIAAAASAGKHIFCEKPVALDLALHDAAVAAAETAGVKLQIGFNRRFDANFARMRQAVIDGEIGQVEILHIISRDPAPPALDYLRTSGGIFLDMTIHDFDMARFLTGSEIVQVYVQGAVLVDPAIASVGDIDSHVTLLRFANGAIGSIENSRRAGFGYDQRAEILGSRGAIHTSNNYPNNVVISNHNTVYRDLPLNFFMQRYVEAFASEIATFVRSVHEDLPVAVSAADARAALVVALAAQRSHTEQRPINIP
ncbi:inositol 2-dehydrogenase [Candidatus Oscillochloris fontis]|uniref:inositol 2-dehydrogenase n=1 Tax=Candidatus Oscillochloris fontis TaxID=2496868 RepID=UPI00101CF133|nr:inositol 2-dehydrogenase [Candidatus Oscillochloris fontis]